MIHIYKVNWSYYLYMHALISIWLNKSKYMYSIIHMYMYLNFIDVMLE